MLLNKNCFAKKVKPYLLSIYNQSYWLLVKKKHLVLKTLIVVYLRTILLFAKISNSRIRLRINLKLVDAKSNVVPAYGNLFLAIGVSNLINTSKSRIVAEVNVKEDEINGPNHRMLKENYSQLIKDFLVIKEQSFSHFRITINIPAKIFWTKSMWLEHILPSLAYYLYEDLESNRNFLFSKSNHKLQSAIITEPYVFWAFRWNEKVNDRNSSLENFIDNFHALTSQFPDSKVIVGTSKSGASKLQTILDRHRVCDWNCEAPKKIILQEALPSKSMLVTILNAEMFFTEHLHGYCDFAFFSEVPFQIKAKPFYLHPKNSKVKGGQYYPWNAYNQVLE
jgi:hypothetical protein